MSKVSNIDLDKLFKKYCVYSSVKELAFEYGISNSYLYMLLKNYYGDNYSECRLNPYRYVYQTYKTDEAKAWLEKISINELLDYFRTKHGDGKVVWRSDKSTDADIKYSCSPDRDCRDNIASPEIEETNIFLTLDWLTGLLEYDILECN